MTKNDRMKDLRKSIKLSQTAFGNELGVSRDVINNLELNRVELSEVMVKAICSVFSVSETWLRTGEGEMYIQTAENEIDTLCDKVGLDSLGKAFLISYADMPETDRAVIKNYIMSVLESVSYEEFRKDYIEENAMPVAARNGNTDGLQELADAFDEETDKENNE